MCLCILKAPCRPSVAGATAIARNRDSTNIGPRNGAQHFRRHWRRPPPNQQDRRRRWLQPKRFQHLLRRQVLQCFNIFGQPYPQFIPLVGRLFQRQLRRCYEFGGENGDEAIIVGVSQSYCPRIRYAIPNGVHWGRARVLRRSWRKPSSSTRRGNKRQHWDRRPRFHVARIGA